MCCRPPPRRQPVAIPHQKVSFADIVHSQEQEQEKLKRSARGAWMDKLGELCHLSACMSTVYVHYTYTSCYVRSGKPCRIYIGRQESTSLITSISSKFQHL